MLAEYVGQNEGTIGTLKQAIEAELCETTNYIEAATLDFQAAAGDRFNCVLSELTLCITDAIACLEKEEASVDQFIEISLKKLDDYTQYHQSIMKTTYYVSNHVYPEPTAPSANSGSPAGKKQKRGSGSAVFVEEEEIDYDVDALSLFMGAGEPEFVDEITEMEEPLEEEIISDIHSGGKKPPLPSQKKNEHRTVPRYIKIDRLSNLNVIRTNTRFVDVACENKSLIVSPPETTTAATSTNQVNRRDPDDKFLQMLTELLSRERLETQKMTIYVARHNLAGQPHASDEARHRLEEVLRRVNTGLDTLIMVELDRAYVTARFETIGRHLNRMREIVQIKKKNAHDYVFNNIGRFRECISLLNDLLVFTTSRGVDVDAIKRQLPSIRPEQEEPDILSENPPSLAAMY